MPKRIAVLCNYELLPERVGGMDYFFWQFIGIFCWVILIPIIPILSMITLPITMIFRPICLVSTINFCFRILRPNLLVIR